MDSSVRAAADFLYYSVLVYLVVRPAVGLVARVLDMRIESFLLASASASNVESIFTYFDLAMEARLPLVLPLRALEACRWFGSGSTLACLVGSRRVLGFRTASRSAAAELGRLRYLPEVRTSFREEARSGGHQADPRASSRAGQCVEEAPWSLAACWLGFWKTWKAGAAARKGTL